MSTPAPSPEDAPLQGAAAPTTSVTAPDALPDADPDADLDALPDSPVADGTGTQGGATQPPTRADSPTTSSPGTTGASSGAPVGAPAQPVPPTGRTPGERGTYYPARRQTTAYAAYLLTSWPIHLGFFLVVILLCSLGAGLAILWIGLPMLAGGITVARHAASWQRRTSADLTGYPAPEQVYALPDPHAPLPQRLLVLLRDPQSWRDVVWVLTGFFVSALTWCLTLVWLAGILAVLHGPVTLITRRALLQFGVSTSSLGDLLGVPYPGAFDTLLGIGVGLFFLFSAPAVLRTLATTQLAYAENMLCHHARDRERIDRLTASRTSARNAEASALRRLERDLHDGPQQRLVRLNMDLARARRQAATNPERAQEIIDGAMAQAQETLDELRQLSRGIAPPVLVDRGLQAAIAEAAARSVVPVTVHADLPTVPVHAASAAYFVVAESLVNINKHSQASTATVSAEVRDGVLHLVVADNGVGGASTAKGHGLAGLVERLDGVDGSLCVSSPVGGPTTIAAVIPCGS